MFWYLLALVSHSVILGRHQVLSKLPDRSGISLRTEACWSALLCSRRAVAARVDVLESARACVCERERERERESQYVCNSISERRSYRITLSFLGPPPLSHWLENTSLSLSLSPPTSLSLSFWVLRSPVHFSESIRSMNGSIESVIVQKLPQTEVGPSVRTVQATQ